MRGLHPRGRVDFKDAASTIRAGIKDLEDAAGSKLFRIAQSL